MSTKFRPVRGKEEKILNQEVTDGFFYIATDTGRIFIDTSEGKVSVGGGAGASLFYADAAGSQVIKISEDTSDKNYLFAVAALENPEVLPKTNDLILNSDGSFFKILSFEGDYMRCLLMTVSGSGSGGGGGVPVQEEDLILSYNSSTISTNKNLVQGQTYYAVFTGTATRDDYVNFEFKFTGPNNWERAFTRTGIPSGEPYNLDLSFLPVGTFKLTVTLSSDNTRMTTLPTRVISNIKVIEMGLTKYGENPKNVINTSESFTHQVSFIPRGAGLNLTLHVFSDGSEISSSPIAATSLGTPNTITLPHQSHGVHDISLLLTTDLNGETYSSEEIHYECAWADPTDPTPIIWVGDYPSTVVKYEPCVVPFMVYDPASVAVGGAAVVRLYINGTEIPTSPIEKRYDQEWANWDVTPYYLEGENSLTIACGVTSKNIGVNITTEGSRNLSLVKENLLQLNLSALGRSNSENKSSKQSWAFGNYNTTFTNFNWTENDGWQSDASGTYLAIANGSSAKINFAKMQLLNQYNYTFEIRFRVRNIRNYSTLIRVIPKYKITDENGVEIKGAAYTPEEIASHNENSPNEKWEYLKDKDGNIVMDEQASQKIASTAQGVCAKMLDANGNGFCIGTQEAYFSAGGNIANVRYKENETINISFVISKTKTSNNNDKKDLFIYLNGILSGATNLDAISPFTLDTNIIEFNSDYCDFDLYAIRVYQSGLTMPEIIHNYISDIKDINLYDQNQLTAETDPTRLLYTKVVKYNEEKKEKVTKDTLNNGLLMPYAVIETLEDVKGIKSPNGNSPVETDDRLPYFKGNDRYCKITFVNPALDLAWENGWIGDEEYLNSSPSYVVVGAEINVQGTSSQAYPRRNYKTKMKSASGDAPAGWTDDENYAWGWYYTNGPKKGEKFKKWHMDSASCATNKFTWKIDYMESSGSYNTGFANLVGNGLYSKHPLEYYDDESGKMQGAAAGQRTSVYGFPVMVFHKHNKAGKYVPSNQSGAEYDEIRSKYAWTGQVLDAVTGETDEWKAYEYIGRYNLNLDKGSNEFYGFEAKVEQPFVDKKWTDSETGEEHNHPYVAEVAECWELRDNQGTWCSFKYPGQATDFSVTSENRLEVIKHFEYRYNAEDKLMDMVNENDVRIENTAVKGYNRKVNISTQLLLNNYARERYGNLEVLFTWLNSTNTENVPSTDSGVPLAQPVSFIDEISYMIKYRKDSQGKETSVYDFLTLNGEIIPVEEITFETISGETDVYDFAKKDGVIFTEIQAPKGWDGDTLKRNTRVTFNTDCKDYRLHKFKTEFNDHLNLEYCLIYFIMTELLLCYDSRGKNMMLASFGPNKEGGDYIWFPIFYDIDTQLGLNNIGAVLWDYDADATIDGNFSTAKSVLWTNFYEVFYDSIKKEYRDLRSSRLNQSFIEGAYLCDPAVFTNSYAMKGLRPIIVLGLDEYTKYIACGSASTGGYYDQDKGEIRTDSSFVYACQGDRKLSRSLLIRNRLNYIDSWWLAGSYTPARVKNEIMIRANANDTNTSDIYLDSDSINTAPTGWELAKYPKKYFDAIPQFSITPFLNQYVTVFYDEDPVLPSKKYNGVTPVETSVTMSVENGYKSTAPYNEQLVYLPAGDNISSFGDLSTKYPSHFKLSTGKNLTEVIVGSDVPGYFNGILGRDAGTFDLHDNGDSDDQKKGLLSKIVLTNIINLSQAQNVSGSPKLREYRVLGTKIPSTVFAPGAPLDTVHLPSSTTELILRRPENLKRILTSRPEVMEEDPSQPGTYRYKDRNTYTGLYVEGVTDDANVPDLFTKIIIVGGGLGYDSYKILEKQVNKKKDVENKYLEIQLDDVNWSPYSLVERGEIYNQNQSYFWLSDHNYFEPYVYSNTSTWNNDLLNEKIYIENEENMGRIDTITDLSLLDVFLDDYNNTLDTQLNKWRSVPEAGSSSSTKTRPTLSGVMYVNNSEDDKIDEVELLEKYKQAWPSLTIYAKYIDESYISKFVQVADTGKEEVVDLLRTKNNEVPLTSKVPVKTYYDFKGWSLSPSADDLVYDYSAGTGEYTLHTGASAPTFSETNTTVVWYAIFERHGYKIKYYLDDGTTLWAEKEVLYGDNVTLPDAKPWKNDSSLAEERTYKFLGYTTTMESSSFVNPTTIKAQRDLNFYCKFKESSVRENVDNSLFNFTQTTVQDLYTQELFNGYVVSPIGDIKGKVTIPTSYNNLPVIGITGFGNQSEVTHIFAQSKNDCQIVDLSGQCFKSCYNLKKCELLEVDSLRNIGQGCFESCSKLEDKQVGGSNLHYIGNGAFTQTFNKNISGDVIISGSVGRIDNGDRGCFYNSEIGSNKFIFGSPTNPCQLTQWTDRDLGRAPIIWFGNNEAAKCSGITIYHSESDRQKFIDLTQTVYSYAQGNNASVTSLYGKSNSLSFAQGWSVNLVEGEN